MSEFSTKARQNLLNKLQKQTRLPGNITGSTPRQIHESVTSNIQSLVNRGEQIRLASQPKPGLFSRLNPTAGGLLGRISSSVGKVVSPIFNRLPERLNLPKQLGALSELTQPFRPTVSNRDELNRKFLEREVISQARKTAGDIAGKLFFGAPKPVARQIGSLPTQLLGGSIQSALDLFKSLSAPTKATPGSILNA